MKAIGSPVCVYFVPQEFTDFLAAKPKSYGKAY